MTKKLDIVFVGSCILNNVILWIPITVGHTRRDVGCRAVCSLPNPDPDLRSHRVADEPATNRGRTNSWKICAKAMGEQFGGSLHTVP